MEISHFNEHVITRPSGGWFEITPDNSTDLTMLTRGIYVGSAGDLVAVSANDEQVTFTGLLAGVVYPFRVKRVLTSTTAQNLVGLY